MQVKTLDGHNVHWPLTGHYSHARLTNKSDMHMAARELLKQQFPTFQIIEEVPIPVRKSDNYYLDFYIPMLKAAIEVHGEQHYKFNKFFFKNKLEFFNAQARDRDKKEEEKNRLEKSERKIEKERVQKVPRCVCVCMYVFLIFLYELEPSR